MTDSNHKPPHRDPVGATVDSVVGAISVLWDWFSAPVKPNEPEPSIIGLLTAEPVELRCGRCDKPIPDGGVCYCGTAPIDTEGSDVDGSR